ncbi:DsbA family protein [Paenibacillus eucommiae]|uniref:Protein-disulfide isomerase n=1 Tax=Paenibacillus eucommiae TaxID=1355755 RepID=A0ABS4J1M1_9BACL|nr:DsbA family protein [Paenibacillus eucommiae]MBP1993727.1 protein-disulfide isomerase [Paenibacillus eucommiae]
MKKNKNMSRNLVIFTLVLVVLFVAIFALTRMADNTDKSVTSVSAPDITGQPVLGKQDAKVTIVEFGDYKCPSCKAWGERILPQLTESYIDTGKAKFSYVNVLFHGEESTVGALAGEAVLANTPDAFWPFHKAIFDAQPDLDHDSLWLTPDKMIEIAGAINLGIDTGKLREAIDSRTTLSQVNKDEALVKKFKVEQTPTIMINNIVITNPFDYALITKTIEDELKK